MSFSSMDFDPSSERCIDCDGHFRHFAPCPLYTGEPVLSPQDRIAVQDLVNSAVLEAGEDFSPA